MCSSRLLECSNIEQLMAPEEHNVVQIEQQLLVPDGHSVEQWMPGMQNVEQLIMLEDQDVVQEMSRNLAINSYRLEWP